MDVWGEGMYVVGGTDVQHLQVMMQIHHLILVLHMGVTWGHYARMYRRMHSSLYGGMEHPYRGDTIDKRYYPR